MLRDKEFYDSITSKIEQISFKPKELKQISGKIYEQFEIPLGLLSDYLTLRVPVNDASDFVLYGLCKQLLSPTEIKKYYSDEEVKFYNKSKFQKQEIQFPLKFDMIQINTSQWIGRITVKELMQLRDVQMINYNERTQRTMERKISHGYEYWQIAINDNAVKEIEDSYEKGTYIPNTITLNLSDESEADFFYDGEGRQLVIRSLKYFDILDGYHRYKAMSKAYNMDDSFDYEMELRIVNFSEKEARQFIWQEDQKTKMSKIDSASYNQHDWAVHICERVARNLPQGIISRNKGSIDLAQLSAAVKFVYDTNNIKNVSEANQIANRLTMQFERMLDENPEAFQKKWSLPMTACVMTLLKEDNVDNVWEKANILHEVSTKQKVWISTNLYKRRVTALQKIIEQLNL